MFTMGHKALILNALRAEDTISAAQCTVKGFCDFLAANATDTIAAGVTASAGVVANADFRSVLPAGAAIGDSINVEIKFNQNRYVSEYTSDFIKQGDTIIFQSALLLAADVAGVTTAIISGWTNYNAAFNIAQTPPLTVAAATGDNALATDFNVVMAADYLNIEKVTIKLVPGGAKTVPAQEYILAVSDDTVAVGRGGAAFLLYGVEGLGQGKFLEESIRTASYTNMDPYANKPHGSDSVDIRGSYTLYEFTGTLNAGWATHETLGTAIADQSVASNPQKFTIYANEADAALIAALDAWIGAI